MSRILHVSHSLPPDGNTGVENYTEAVSEAQAEAGHAVAAFARGMQTNVPAGTEERDIVNGVARLRIHFGPGHQFVYSRQRSDMAYHFQQFVAEWKPDIVHFQHLLYHSLEYPRIAREAGAATVLTLHDLWFTCPTVQRVDFRGALCGLDAGRTCLPCTWNARRAEVISRDTITRLVKSSFTSPFLDLMPTTRELSNWTRDSQTCLNHIDTVISPSKFVRNNFIQHGLVHPRVVFLDYGITRPAPVVDVEREPGEIRFGLIATHALKGIDVILQAFENLTDLPNVRLMWYGADPNSAAAAKVPSNVTVAGRFEAADIERVYSSFDILAVPSIWWENAPIVIREAFARRKPVIASRIGGMAESVRDNVDGLLFPVGDSRELEECVRRIARTPNLIARLRSGIKDPTFFDEHIRDLDKLYAEAAARPSGLTRSVT